MNDWKDIASFKPAGSTNDATANFEDDFHLPEISSGSPRQIKYAREVRWQFLRQILPNILDIADQLTAAEKSAAFNELNRLRRLTSPVEWINLHQRVSSPIDHILHAVHRVNREKQGED